ncbi:TonB-dependent receptor domain-containing protein [Acinetobacter larvae]|uniref:TonB-dependent receptor n=1 Tax=Acinetobacter larvae TaxID=1789224 RepID=A0A1B2LYT2_9GAMM|nr:TonB-dependent receptor [Acinetobacter larvae]AOA58049.1 hypothetical protein BFG52_06580 [Acinetobacter larvae]
MKTCFIAAQVALKPLTLCIVLWMGGASQACKANQPSIYYQIPANTLTNALNEVALQSNVSLLFDAQHTDLYAVASLIGHYTPEQAFEKLLEKTPFHIQSTAAGYLLQQSSVAQDLPKRAVAGATMSESLSSTNLSTAVARSDAAEVDVVLSTIELNADKDRYAQGKDDQFQKDIVNIYKNKDELEHFKGSHPADILSGIPGVYSSDARNSGAISPNVRGLQGQGRVPVIVDGTQQEVSVYRGYAGVHNRTYIDPNLLSETTVYKGATELNYAIPPAIGGAVMLNTLNGDDVIAAGKDWGINLRYETNNNSTKARMADLNYGEDYRTPENWSAVLGDLNPQLYQALARQGKNKFFQDHAFRLAIAAKNDLTDIMLAYSQREQGNYFSGKRGGNVYQTRFDHAHHADIILNTADIAPPGYEVTNSSSHNRSALFKNNWYFGNHQKLKLSWRHSDIAYGEIMNSRAVYGYVVDQLLESEARHAAQWPLAKVKQHAGRIDYEWNADDFRWINLKVGAWYNNTDSRNNSTGAPPISPKFLSSFWAAHVLQKAGCLGENGIDRNCQVSPDIIQSANALIGHADYNDERFKLVNPALQISANDRWGIDFSNSFTLHSQLELQVGGSLQKEKLNARNIDEAPLICSDIEQINFCKSMPFVFGPKSGERQEYSTWFNLDWHVNNQFTINIGGRWGRYWSLDTQLDEKLKTRQWSRPKILAAKTYEQLTPYDIKMAEEEMKTTPFYHRVWSDASQQWDEYYDHEGYIKSQGYDGQSYNSDSGYWKYKYIYWEADENGVLHAHNAPGTIALKDGEKIIALLGGGLNDIAATHYRPMTEEEQYAPVGKRRDQQFDPSLSLSYTFHEFSRVYARYVEATRFPSLYESTVGFAENIRTQGFVPEHAQNIEFGYVHDLKQWLRNWRNADLKINYYYNKINDIIDRNYSTGSFAQYDQLKTQGLELQVGFDQGLIFGDLGYSYLIKSEMCDKDYAAQLSPIYLDAPTCFMGGFPGGYLRGAIPPKHAMSTNLGARILDDRLILGTRLSYHSMSNLKKQSTEGWVFPNQGLDSYGWKSYWTVDAYADYWLTAAFKISLIGTNLLNEYYPDALTRTAIPSPGRTFKVAFDYKF